MSRWGQSLLAERTRHRVARIRAWGQRLTASGVALRAAVWATGSVALVLGTPGGWRLPPVWVLAGAVALAAAAGPQGAWVSVVTITPVALLAGGAVVAGHEPALWQVMLLATALYLHHSLAALAANLRTDTLVPAAVFLRWVWHAGGVLAASALLWVAILTLPARAPAWSATAYIALGTTAAVVLAAALATLLHRKLSR